MHIILGILGSLAGLAVDGGPRFLLWAVIGILIAEVLAQRRRITTLENAPRPLAAVPEPEVVFIPADEDEAANLTAPTTRMPAEVPRHPALIGGKKGESVESHWPEPPKDRAPPPSTIFSQGLVMARQSSPR